MRIGRRLALDVGRVRIGVAISDPHGILASPLLTLAREDVDRDLTVLFDSVIDFTDLLEIYVGLPINLKGELTPSTEDAISVAESIASVSSIPVRLIDERLTTSIANSQLRSLRKSQKDARATVDQMAAVAILEYAFQVEAHTGLAPGKTVQEWKAEHD